MWREFNAFTGDVSNTGLYILLAVAAVGIVALTVLPRIFAGKNEAGQAGNGIGPDNIQDGPKDGEG